MDFTFYKQHYNKMDCGSVCLRMIAKHYGKNYTSEYLYHLTKTTESGSNLLEISEAARKIGFRTISVEVTFSKLYKAPLPCIAHWNKSHFVVIYRIEKDSTNNSILQKKIIHIADPAIGILKYTQKEFLKSWKSTGNKGILLLFFQ
jgi:ATP-binding cassette subfamily B protein